MGLSYFGDDIEEVVLAVHVTVWGKVDVTFYLIPALSNKTPPAATVAIYISCGLVVWGTERICCALHGKRLLC